MTVVSSAPVSKPPTYPLARIAVVCWLALAALAGVSANAQTPDGSAIGFDWTVSPGELGPGSTFTIDGTITIDPDNEALEGEGGTIAWTLAVGPISDVAIDNAMCGETDGTSCEADVTSDEATITFSGVVEDDPPGDVTADVEITGTIDDQLDRDTILLEAETCGTVEIVSGTPAPGRLPISAATPDATCEGVAGTIEVTVVPATENPTEEPTPTIQPTEEPTATPTPSPTIEPTATAEPTEAPTQEPTATPTEESTPTTEPTVAPTATVVPTATPEPTDVPTEAPTATPEPTATIEPTAIPTEAPTAIPTEAPTEVPTEIPTEEPTATTAPTAVPTDEPTATAEPTEAPVVEPTAPATEAPQPTPDADDGNTAGLWIGGGSLLVLAVVAGAVLYQRRKIAA